MIDGIAQRYRNTNEILAGGQIRQGRVGVSRRLRVVLVCFPAWPIVGPSHNSFSRNRSSPIPLASDTRSVIR